MDSAADKDPGSSQSRKRGPPKEDVPTCKFQKLEQSPPEDVKDVPTTSSFADFKSHQSSIDDIPTPLVVKIFKSLSLYDLLLRAGLVCKNWNNLTHDPDLWREVNLTRQSKVNDEILIRLCSYSSNVTSICAPALRTLTGKGIQTVLKKCPSLQHLSLSSSLDLERIAFDAIGEHCPKLLSVNLSSCDNMNDEALTKIARHCQLLETVILSQCHYLTDKGVQELAQNCPRIKVLELKHNTKITDVAVETICENCKELKGLSLSGCGVTSASLQHIAKLPKLESLELVSIGPVRPFDIRDVVKNCGKLSSLNLSLSESIDDHCVEVIVTHAKELRALYLVSCNITDKSLKIFGNSCKTLEKLDIGWCQAVTDWGVSQLCRYCPNLKYLGLMRCDAVTDRTALALTKIYPRCTISTMWLDVNRLLENATVMPSPVMSELEAMSGN